MKRTIEPLPSDSHDSHQSPVHLSSVILIGGPTGATQFRPLSLDSPKPLFPIAGKPMIYHQIAACTKVKDLDQIFLLGDFPRDVFAKFIEETEKEFNIKITYLREEKPLGTAGGLYKFYKQIISGRKYFFLLHSDICCSFPLEDLLKFHTERSAKFSVTMMGTKVDKEASITYGCYVADENHKMVHYAEHPSLFISSTINAGVYIFNCSLLEKPFTKPHVINELDVSLRTSGFLKHDEEILSMERDLLPSLVNEGKVAAYEYNGFWRSIKNPGGAVYANEQYMKWYQSNSPSILQPSIKGNFESVGGVIVHPTSVVDSTAKIGPNVYLGPNVHVGPGSRIHNSIILENVKVKQHACIMYSIIGEESVIGAWTRIEGLPSATAATFEGRDARYRREGITLFGKGVVAGSEIIVRNSIVMPHKSIKASVFNEILL